MPGPDFSYPGRQDLYPETADEHADLLGWILRAFRAAEQMKKAKEEKWGKYHQAYRSYMEQGSAAGWRSNFFVPEAFSIIEGITPKMVANLPRFVCWPVGPEDVIPARLMEEELNRDADQTNLHVELIRAIKTSLKFGTGLLKTYYYQDIRRAYEMQPVMVPREVENEVPALNPETGEQLFDIDGTPQTTMEKFTVEEPQMDPETGEPVMQRVPYEYVVYQGPAAKWVDPFNFYVAPRASSLDDAQYVIEKVVDKDKDYVEAKLREGIYRLPPGVDEFGDMFGESDTDGQRIRAEEVGDEDPRQADDVRNTVELLECHLKDGRLITVLNRAYIVRVTENPFFHGEYPYVDFPDYLQEGEFWGMGEIEAIEGLQDLLNALVNQRVDNVRLTMDAMFAVNAQALEDERDLVIRPGGIIRLAGDYLPSEAVQRIDLGDVTSSAFIEADNVKNFIEQVSGMSGYQYGQLDDQGAARTATGVSLVSEQGNTKFQMKVTLMELVGLRRLARHWGAIVQQFLDEERTIRIQGPQGQWLFPTLTPDAIQGALDYRIDVMSSTQTETVLKEQSLALLDAVGRNYPPAVPALIKDVLEAFNKRDVTPYLMGTLDLGTFVQMQQAQASGGFVLPQQQQQPPAMNGNGQRSEQEQTQTQGSRGY